MDAKEDCIWSKEINVLVKVVEVLRMLNSERFECFPKAEEEYLIVYN